MVRTLGLLVALTVAGVIQAASNPECLAVSVAIKALHATSGADSFCSSLLHISPKTTTTTTTSTGTSTSTYDTASTITLTNAAAGTSTVTASTITTVVTSISTIQSNTCVGVESKKKRTVLGKPTTTSTKITSTPTSKETTAAPVVCTGAPSGLSNFACSLLTTACECLSLPTSTATATSVIKTTKLTTKASTGLTTTFVPTVTTTTPTSTSTTVVYTATPVCICDSFGGGTPCNGQCVDLINDPHNCGTCGNFLTGSQCGVDSSGNSIECCQGSCIDTFTDPNHCGGCGNSCDTGYTCNNTLCTIELITSANCEGGALQSCGSGASGCVCLYDVYEFSGELGPTGDGGPFCGVYDGSCMGTGQNCEVDTACPAGYFCASSYLCDNINAGFCVSYAACL